MPPTKISSTFANMTSPIKAHNHEPRIRRTLVLTIRVPLAGITPLLLITESVVSKVYCKNIWMMTTVKIRLTNCSRNLLFLPLRFLQFILFSKQNSLFLFPSIPKLSQHALSQNASFTSDKTIFLFAPINQGIHDLKKISQHS